MKTVLYFLLVSLAIVACQPTKTTENSPVDSMATTTSPKLGLNQLTPDQVGDGWQNLFDGATLKGWHYYKNKANGSWEVADSALHCKADAAERADLTTDQQFENFELVFDWKISPQGNSGVIYHVVEDYDQPYASGPEYQVIDDEGYPGDLKDVQLTAANYDMQVAKDKKLNLAGEWNTGKIVVSGNHVEHWLNGAKVLEYELGSEEWNQLRQKSKWKDYPGYGAATKGSIDLQNHGNEVWFRNIFIKPL